MWTEWPVSRRQHYGPARGDWLLDGQCEWKDEPWVPKHTCTSLIIGGHSHWTTADTLTLRSCFPWLIIMWAQRVFPGEGNGNPLLYTCLENPMDRGASQAIVHGVTKGRTWLSNYHSYSLKAFPWISSRKTSRLFHKSSKLFFSVRVFSNELTLSIRWLKYWSFSFSISPPIEYSELISFRMDWFDLLAVQGVFKSLLQHHSSKASILWHAVFFIV